MSVFSFDQHDMLFCKFVCRGLSCKLLNWFWKFLHLLYKKGAKQWEKSSKIWNFINHRRFRLNSKTDNDDYKVVGIWKRKDNNSLITQNDFVIQAVVLMFNWLFGLSLFAGSMAVPISRSVIVVMDLVGWFVIIKCLN